MASAFDNWAPINKQANNYPYGCPFLPNGSYLNNDLRQLEAPYQAGRAPRMPRSSCCRQSWGVSLRSRWWLWAWTAQAPSSWSPSSWSPSSWSLCLSWATWPQASPCNPSSVPYRVALQQDWHHQQFHPSRCQAHRPRRSPPPKAWRHRAQPPHAVPPHRRHLTRHQHQRTRRQAPQTERT